MTELEHEQARRAEALDPATPPERLAALLEAHLELVLANPGWPLLLLAEPDFWQRLPGPVLLGLARSPSCPEALADWVLTHVTDTAVLDRLAANRALPDAVRRRALLSVPSPLDEDGLVAMAGLLTVSEARLLQRCIEPAPEVPLSPADFERLEALGRRGQALALSKPGCPSDVVERLAAAFPLLAASHPQLPLRRLEVLLRSPDVDLRCEAARNPSLPPSLLPLAAADPLTRAEVAAWAKLTDEWVETFLRDPDEKLRERLATNDSLPVTAQRTLALDQSREVREALLYNSSVEADVRQLAQRTNRQETARTRAGSK
jgi:hypothetical protein